MTVATQSDDTATGATASSSPARHHITRALVRGARVATLRVRCSCGEFEHDAPRLSTPGRRKLDRLVNEHMVSADAGAINAALDIATRSAFEAPL